MTTRSYFLLLALATRPLLAQTDRGIITGTVSDAGGRPIPDVSITATHQATNTRFKTATTESGEFNLSFLRVGLYRVIVQIEGFKVSVHENVTLEAGATVRLDTRLEIGAVQQTIEVSAQSS